MLLCMLKVKHWTECCPEKLRDNLGMKLKQKHFAFIKSFPEAKDFVKLDNTCFYDLGS